MVTQAQAPRLLSRFLIATGKSVRVLIYTFIGILLAIWLFSPLAIRLSLNYVLDAHNLSVDDKSIIRINPFLARISIDDLILKEAKKNVLETQSLIIDVAWLPMLQQEINIEAFNINGFYIDSQFSKSGQLHKIAGFVLPKPTVDKKPEASQTQTIPWRITLNESAFSDSVFNVFLPHKKQAIELNNLSLSEVEVSQQSQNLALALKLKVDDTTANLTSRINLTNGLGEISTQLTLTAIDLAQLKSWLPEQTLLKSLKGIVDVKFESRLKLSADNLDIIKNNLHLNIADFEYSHEQGDIQFRQLVVDMRDINLNLEKGKPTHLSALVEHSIKDLIVDQLPSPNPKIKLSKFELSLPEVIINFEDGLLAEMNLPLTTQLTELSAIGGVTPDMISVLQQFTLSTPKLSLLFEEQRPTAISVQGNVNLHQAKAENANGILADFAGITLEEFAVFGEITQPEIDLSMLSIHPFVLSRVHTVAQSAKPSKDIITSPDATTEEVVPNTLTTAESKSTDTNSDDLTSIEQPALLNSNGITISHINIDQQDIQIGDITLDHLEANAFINADKQLSTLVALTSPDDTSDVGSDDAVNQENKTTETTDKAHSDTQPAAQKTALRISLNSFELLNNAVINVRDDSIKPAYERGFEFSTLSLGKISMTEPDLETPYQLKGKSDRYAVIDFAGFIKPLAAKTHYTTKGFIKELDLPGLSPYVKAPLKHEIKTGQLDLNVKVDILNEVIDGQADILLRGLELSAANNIEASTIKDSTAMPLNMAVGVLKDGDNNLGLNIPLGGTLSKPSVDGLSGLVVLLSKKAAMKAATSLLMDTFVPYSNIVSVAMMAGEYALKVRFNDLPFSLKQTSLNDQQIKFANDFVALMKDKEDTQINLCAISTPADIDLPAKTTLTQEQITQLNKLSQARQHAFKDYVLQGGIASSRILLCAPSVDSSKDAKPRLSFSS